MNKAVIKTLGGKKPDQKRKVRVHVTAYRNGTKIGRSLECHSAGPKNRHTNAKKIKTSKNTYKLKVGRATKLKAKTIKIKNCRPLLGKIQAFTFPKIPRIPLLSPPTIRLLS